MSEANVAWMNDDQTNFTGGKWQAFPDVMESVDVTSFTLHKVERLCFFMFIDVVLITLFVLVEFIIPYFLWFPIFWGWTFPPVGSLETHEKTVSILIIVLFSFTLFFMFFVLSYLIFDFFYVFSQLRLSFNIPFFRFISRVYTVVSLLCVSIKFILQLIIVIFVSAFPDLYYDIGVQIFWILIFSFDLLFFVIPLTLQMFPRFKRSWLFKCGLRDVDPGFLVRDGMVARWKEGLENKIPKMYVDIFVFLVVVDVVEHMGLLVWSWTKGILRLMKGMCAMCGRSGGDDEDMLMNEYMN